MSGTRSSTGGDHASARLIDAYARGGDGAARGGSGAGPGGAGLAADEVWALESHLEACAECRERLSAAVMAHAPGTAALVGTVWSELEPRVAAEAAAAAGSRSRTRAAARLPGRLSGRLPGRLSGRLSGWLTPAMVPWLAMVVSVTVAALLLDLTGAGLGEASTVLLVAPVLPVFGVAASWSRGLDPAYELTAAAPRAGLDLVLRRTASVLAVVVPALLAGGWATGVMVAQWLLPCLAFTSATLALGGVIGVTRAAVALVAAWAALIAAPTLAAGRTALALSPAGLPVWGLVLALGTGVVLARGGAYAVLGAHR
ncbi:zf-HC2 domain-containing protein [Streptomyces albiaxialis]|uniref:Zf-HC2 domain-containing protein n=1 Tax=Streptomyces albiaxialis TaxID=329523 RepID=A0ABN2VP69_9ACTN